MSKRYSSSEILRVLHAAGFDVVRQRGSHLKLRDGGGSRTVIIPHPVKEVPVGTFTSVLRQAGLTRADFEALL